SFYFGKRDIIEAQTGVVQCERALEMGWRFGRPPQIDLDLSFASQVSQRRRKLRHLGRKHSQPYLLMEFRQIQFADGTNFKIGSALRRQRIGAVNVGEA